MIDSEIKTRIRIYTPRVYANGQSGPEHDYKDFEAEGTRIDISPDGSMLLTQMKPTGEQRLNPNTGKLEDGLVIRILAVFGPDGRLRAETVEE